MTPTATALATILPPAQTVPSNDDAPVRKIDPQDLLQLGQNMDRLFRQYVSDRRIAELRWTRNQRQYLGVYDPEIDKLMSVGRSRAYPRITRVKCISVLARIMNLMFPGNERNWELKAAPNADISKKDVKEAIAKAVAKDQKAGVQPAMDLQYVMDACQELANGRAEELSKLIDDQLQELGGDQTYDYVALNREVLRSGIIYGLGLLRGPYARKDETVVWKLDAKGEPVPSTTTVYKPVFEFLDVWDFYPDMSAKKFRQMDGYFVRQVMSRAQVRDLADRAGFFKKQVIQYLTRNPNGNYRPQPFELDLRSMGVRVNVNELRTETSKYEVISWHGKLSGEWLRWAGVDVPDDKVADHLDAELWMIDGNVIMCDLNPWVELGIDVDTLHAFVFDEDDTSLIGSGLPNNIRDSQMAISAATRMLMDNASVVCGPNLELNTDLLRADQDLSSTTAYKIWYREGTGPDAQFPAVKNIDINSHMTELLKIIELFMKFADTETFVGPATGGDMSQTPSEPMRTAAGASMLRGDAALPFKDIVRSFDGLTQSIIQAMVQFNRKFNPKLMPEADYDVIARGATSLIAKEIRGQQVDQLAATLTPEEKQEVDMRKLVKARFDVRDLGDLLLSQADSDRAARQRAQAQQTAQQSQDQIQQANVRKLSAGSFKDISQAQKNMAASDAASIKSAIEILEKGLQNSLAIMGGQGGQAGQAGAGGGDQVSSQPQGNNGGPGVPGGPGVVPGGGGV
jgi:hypothetical protein